MLHTIGAQYYHVHDAVGFVCLVLRRRNRIGGRVVNIACVSSRARACEPPPAATVRGRQCLPTYGVVFFLLCGIFFQLIRARTHAKERGLLLSARHDVYVVFGEERKLGGGEGPVAGGREVMRTCVDWMC